jgi:adenine-specific DNA-methyltransferase
MTMARGPSANAEIQKNSGAFYTPNEVVQTLLHWAVRDRGDLLLDPACGDGRFLAAHQQSVGVEMDEAAAGIARERSPSAQVHQGDFFSWAEDERTRFDCACGNPPFIRYQRFAGTTRDRALTLCKRLGVRVSALTSSWVPFLIVAASLLKRGGRMAFVVPAEVGHAPYAAPLIWFLTGNFRRVQIVAIRRRLFERLSEDAWLLYAEGFRDSTDHIVLTQLDEFERSGALASEGTVVALSDWEKWRYRLRPFLLGADIRAAYERLCEAPDTLRLQSIARVGIGYVTGANDFFHLRPSTARRAGVPDALLCPTVRNSRLLPRDVLTSRIVEGWLRRDEPVLLLRLHPDQDLPSCVARYLDSPEGHAARASYKCRNRDPWYVVPDVSIPDAFLTYMSGEGPLLVANKAHCACTNSLHAVRMKNGARISDLQAVWHHPLTRLSCEVEGHPLGGGMLKLEPGEAASLIIPNQTVVLSRRDLHCLEDGIAQMRRWRHYV